MKRLLLILAVSLALAGCHDKHHDDDDDTPKWQTHRTLPTFDRQPALDKYPPGFVGPRER